jgi:small subunit ribosomal protein S9
VSYVLNWVVKIAEKVFHVAGKRKRAIARATIRAGKGMVRINSKLLELCHPKLARLRMMEPLQIAGDLSGKVKIDVNVKGGGWQGQADASRLAIARALVGFSKDKNLHKTFLEYDRHLIVADTRRAETSKPNDSKPRKKRTKSYR